ncbi:serine/threonine protein kinase [Nocardia sp. NBC_00565]|uniref:serine/threonine-protein kinase n=1 Tax=Nocardia sp. NBC_00565 TaxID=2975993 RepID=UPI002E8171D3|nr:serine/threonine-protein kinase [Nocardia sp. NBC_00565]WUC00360.1 serine/threonine protein kinase [Nocardia sp. NBC_00565]
MLERGTVFAGYRIERVLGSGGMGAVYMARHPRLPRWDALKILHHTALGDGEFATRFEREAEHVAHLDHRNIVAVHDCGIEQNQPWLSMQYIDGRDLAKILAQGPVSVTRAVYILGEVARGLDHAHRAGIWHRDVKPANILVAAVRDEEDRVLVTDFGIARALDDSVSLTATGAVVATLAYAAPEQIQRGDVDHRVDVYALGATLFKMLTGTQPYRRSSALAVMHAHLSEPPPKPSAIDPALEAFDEVIARAMAKNPDDRFQTCRALAEAATSALGDTATPPPLPVTGPPAVGPVNEPNAETILAARARRESPVPERVPGHAVHARSGRPGLALLSAMPAIGVAVLIAVIAFLGYRDATGNDSSASTPTRISVLPPPLRSDGHGDYTMDMAVSGAGDLWLLYKSTGIVLSGGSRTCMTREQSIDISTH